MGKKNTIAFIVINIIEFIVFIINLIAIIFYFNNKTTDLFTLCGIINIIDILFLSQGKGLPFAIALSIGSSIVFKNLWLGICFGTILESLFTFIFGMIFYIFAFIASKKSENNIEGANINIPQEPHICVSMPSNEKHINPYKVYSEEDIEQEEKIEKERFEKVREERYQEYLKREEEKQKKILQEEQRRKEKKEEYDKHDVPPAFRF